MKPLCWLCADYGLAGYTGVCKWIILRIRLGGCSSVSVRTCRCHTSQTGSLIHNRLSSLLCTNYKRMRLIIERWLSHSNK